MGGLHRYHQRHGDCPDALRMTLPINLRRNGDDAAGNHFAPARFAVPASIANPRERVQAIRALACKASMMPDPSHPVQVESPEPDEQTVYLQGLGARRAAKPVSTFA